jgi:lipoprotein-anchoring transpeptidase ErfK/SrfK
MRGRPRQAAMLGATSALALVVTGCGGSDAPAEPVAVNVPPVAVSANPANGTSNVLTSVQPVVTAANGKLTGVVVRDGKGRVIPGRLATTGGSWKASGALVAGRTYTVQASGLDTAGRPFQKLSTFRTIKPKKLVKTYVTPIEGQTVGIGQPIAVTFSKPILDRAAVESRLQVETSRPIEGAWHWMDDQRVHFRPREYWPARTDVTLRTSLKDVNVGNDVYGEENRTISFRIGRSQISVVDVDKYTMTVFRNGKQVKVFPVSTGKPGFRTRGGKKVVLGSERSKTMDARSIGISPGSSEYYNLFVEYAVRITWSGEFIHAAPWSLSSQGRENVSHGCVGMSMSNAIWLFNQSTVGDIVKVVGSPRPLEPGNGYTDWNVSWDDWLAGSALQG